SYALSWKPCQGDSLNLLDHRAQVDQESQIKMIQVKEMMKDKDLKNSKSKDKGSRSRSQSMNEQSHYKQEKTKAYRNAIEVPNGNDLVPLRSDTIRLVQNGCSFHGLRSKDANQHLKDFLEIMDSIDCNVEIRERTQLCLFQFSLRDQASNWLERLPAGSISTCWNDPRDFAKPVKAISMPHDVPSASDRRLIELENQVQRMMEAHLSQSKPIQVNKIASLCEICSCPHDTQYCMEDPERAFVEYTSMRTNEAGNKWYTFKPEENNLGDTYNPSWKSHPNLRWRQPQNTRKNFSISPNRFQSNGSYLNRSFNNTSHGLNQSNLEEKLANFMASQDAKTYSDTVKNPKLNTNPASSARSHPAEDPQSSSNSFKSVNAIQTCFKSNTCDKKDQLQVDTLTVSENETPTLKEPKETLEDKFADLHLNRPVLEVLSHVPMYDTLLDKYIARGLKPLITLADLGSCVNLLPLKLFKELKVGLLEETDDVLGLADGTKSYPLGIVRNVEVHVGKLKLFEEFHVVDMERESTCPLLVGRGFLAIANAESDDLIENPIDWNRPPKERDGAWHIRIELIDTDGEKFDRAFQSILTNRRLSLK
ncbi:MAK10-like protein, partial [Tanacetum coccineum]